MSVTKVIELNASSGTSIEDAIKHGLSRAATTVKNIKGVWVNEIKASTNDDGSIKEWRVNMRINFLVD
ncbi:MAG: dodecin family protein [Rhodanobacteraceae bacterium]